MALYHLCAKIISRGKDGSSACAAAAYRSGEKITSEYDGVTSDYRVKKHVEEAIILLPENAPAAFSDRETLWNSVERIEKSSNAQLAREIEFALPIELSPEEQKQIAIEFIQEQFVDKGMIADVCFHKQHLKKDPDESISANPHCHVMLTLRPLDKNGNWEPKNSTVYVCERNGIQKLLSSEDLKNEEGWEKLYCYTDPNGQKSWYTKSFVQAHQEIGYKLVNKYPKRENIQNPTMKKWNSVESLMEWRSAWAEKQNMYFDTHGIKAHVDHRSYATQGVEFIPSIHEGKEVTAIERKLAKEYGQKISRGEAAVLRHTEIRNLNIAIEEHNHEIRIIAEMQKLREQLDAIIAPVRERIEAFELSLAEKLERLRAEIIYLTIKIKSAVELKGNADEQISSNRTFIQDLAPARKEQIEQLQHERRALKRQLEATTGLLVEKKRAELADRIELLDAEISVAKESRKYAIDANREIQRLQSVSETAGIRISHMQAQRNDKTEEYSSIESQIPIENRLSVQTERLSLRPEIEKDYMNDRRTLEFLQAADSIDRKLGCAPSDLSINPGTDARTPKLKFTSLD